MTKKTAFASLLLALLAGAAQAQQLPTGPVAVQDKTQPSARLNPAVAAAAGAKPAPSVHSSRVEPRHNLADPFTPRPGLP